MFIFIYLFTCFVNVQTRSATCYTLSYIIIIIIIIIIIDFIRALSLISDSSSPS